MEPSTRIGPVRVELEAGRLTLLIVPSDYVELVRSSGGVPDGAGRGRWWVETRRLGALTKRLERHADPLFAHAGLSL